MDKLVSSLPIALPILAMLLVGVIFKNKKIIDENGNGTIKKLIVNLMLPAVLINSFMTADYNFDVLKVFVVMFGVCCILFFAFSLIKSQPLLKFLMTGFEAGMLGYAMFLVVFANVPNIDISKFAVLDLGQCIFVFTVYSSFVKSGGERNIKKALFDMLKSPIIIAIIIGVILGITKFVELNDNLNQTIVKILEFASIPTACLVLISVGFDLDFSKSVIKKASIYAILRTTVMVCAGIATYFVIKCFVADVSQFLYPILLMFILPPPYVLPIMQTNETDRRISSTTVSLSTVIFLLACIGFIIALA